MIKDNISLKLVEMFLKARDQLGDAGNKGARESHSFTYTIITSPTRDLNLEINKSKENNLYNFYFDFSNEDQITNVANNICSKFDQIDGLVNNAGINHVSLFLMDKIEDIKKVFQINFFSQLIFSKIIIKKMISKKQGSIIFLSSKAATDYVSGRLAYSASKSSLINTTKILSKELGRYKIRVNAIAPGLIDTDMSK